MYITYIKTVGVSLDYNKIHCKYNVNLCYDTFL